MYLSLRRIALALVALLSTVNPAPVVTAGQAAVARTRRGVRVAMIGIGVVFFAIPIIAFVAGVNGASRNAVAFILFGQVVIGGAILLAIPFLGLAALYVNRIRWTVGVAILSGIFLAASGAFIDWSRVEGFAPWFLLLAYGLVVIAVVQKTPFVVSSKKIVMAGMLGIAGYVLYTSLVPAEFQEKVRALGGTYPLLILAVVAAVALIFAARRASVRRTVMAVALLAALGTITWVVTEGELPWLSSGQRSPICYESDGGLTCFGARCVDDGGSSVSCDIFPLAGEKAAYTGRWEVRRDATAGTCDGEGNLISQGEIRKGLAWKVSILPTTCKSIGRFNTEAHAVSSEGDEVLQRISFRKE